MGMYNKFTVIVKSHLMLKKDNQSAKPQSYSQGGINQQPIFYLTGYC